MAEDNFEQDYEPDWSKSKGKSKFNMPKISWKVGALIVGAVIIVVALGGFIEPSTTGEAVISESDIGGTDFIVLNDKRCDECDTSRIITSLKELFPDAEVTEVDYKTPEGKALYEETGIEFLPAVLFKESVKDSDNYANIERYLEEKGDYLSLRIGASFDPTAEICDNGIDDTGNGKIDCEDETCATQMICRENIPERLDVFVMSQCPFGTRALDSMKEVLENFKGQIDFHVNYIATENPDGSFRSLHGQAEVDEDIRELCAIEHYPDNYKYMDYIWCRNKDIKSEDWEGCAKEAGMDVNVIKTCFEGDEGGQLLSENLKFAEELGIGASPTWLANNRHKFSGIDAETIKTNYCKVNPELVGCEAILSGSTGPGGTC